MTHIHDSGILYIVATPLGNLEDMTFRAARILREADLIAAEDTRHSKKLLAHYEISTPLISCHEHNERQKTSHLIEQLKAGKTIALISDAGTPCISDPGYTLVRGASKERIPVLPIPGCSAVIAGLSVAGLPTDAFHFIGFPPKKQQKLKTAILNVSKLNATLILYESPKRISGLINAILPIMGDRQACLAREMTKLHEEYVKGKLSEILHQIENRTPLKGECSLFIEGYQGDTPIDDEQLKEILLSRLSDQTAGTSTLARQIAGEFKISKKHVYDMILTIKNT